MRIHWSSWAKEYVIQNYALALVSIQSLSCMKLLHPSPCLVSKCGLYPRSHTLDWPLSVPCNFERNSSTSLTSVISCPQKAIFSLYLKLASQCHRYSFESIIRLAVHASGLPNILISMTWHTPAYICIHLLATWWWPACHHVLPGYKSLTLPINSYRTCVPLSKHICFPVHSSCTSPVPS